MDGIFDYVVGVPQCTQDLLASLCLAPIASNVLPFLPWQYITGMDNTRAWQRAKEKTSAGASGLHFGVFKAHSTHQSVSALEASMQSVAYTTGFSYTRWRKGIDVQLLKWKKDF